MQDSFAAAKTVKDAFRWSTADRRSARNYAKEILVNSAPDRGFEALLIINTCSA